MKKFLLLMLVLLWASFESIGQSRAISGKVISAEDGSSLPGVNVLVKGTTDGTVTDAEGKYSLLVPPNAVLIFSFIGLKSEEASVGELAIVDVSMSSDVTQLTEVVITGVGSATDRKKVAIDVASVSGKNLVPSAVGSMDQALQGKIAGAQIQLNDGSPGATANIQLRGINSLGDSNPIILLDGIQITTMAGLDITNIDRVEVVKGAAAGMLYGAQGANGVIQIFTKKGAKDRKIAITYNGKYFVDEAIRGKVDLIASMHHYDTDANGYILSTGGGAIAADATTGTWTDPLVNLTADLKNDKPYKEKTYNHLDQAYRTAKSQNHSLNISGAEGKVDYNLNVNWLTQENVRNGRLQRQNISLNLGAELVKGLTLRSITQVMFEDENLLSGNRFALVNSYPWIDFNSTYTNGYKVIKPKSENEYNPLSELEWRTRSGKTNKIIENVNLNYKFPKFFEVDYKYGIQVSNLNDKDIVRSQKGYLEPSDAFWGPSPGTGGVTIENQKSTYQNSLLSLYARLNFKDDFNWNIPLTSTTQFTYDWRKDIYEQFSGTANGFAYPPYNLSNGQSQSTSSELDEFITYGYLVNQTFDYGDLLGVSIGFRSDYSSEFGFTTDGSSVKPYTFPRGTAYFNVSELFKSNLIGNWKLRAAYGEAGVQPNRYARQVTLSSQTYGTASGLYNPSTAKNAALVVQRNKELELGSDLTLIPLLSDSWLNKVTLGFTYWDRKGKDIIQPANLPPSSGAGQILDNLISLSSHGIELSADMFMLNTKNFSWNLGLRYATAKTVVDKISQGLDVPYGDNGTFLIREGQPLGVMIGQVPIRSLDEKSPDGTPYIADADKAGYEVVSTQYGDLVVNKTTKVGLLTGADDKRVMGNPQPKFFGSIINDFTLFKNIQVNMQWDFVKGNKIFNQTRQWLYRDRLSKDFDLPVTINGESGAYVTMYNSMYNSIQPTGWFVEDGSFMRLRSLSVSYNLKSILNANWTRQFSVTLSGRNLVTFTNYRGLDPESTSVGSDGTNGPTRGIDSFGFPNVKSYQVGLTIGL
ncbi:MAG TPA: SusC/RagA family TonB-linked outer membrane protein [Ohtaekwangia sp.]|uniref:SusC/RagA family TonB-linked outer membrane protein n=1 Tax=Ohtaekwangia sp. TaxID=2066019 RepID=UPI002F91D9E9